MASKEEADALAAKLRGHTATEGDALESIIQGARITEPEEDNDETDELNDTDDEDSEADDTEEEEAGDTEEEADDGDDEDEEEGDEGYSEYSDDDVIDVLVDGEYQDVTLRDLKKAYSGEGAIEKRLKEATEARKQANAARQQAFEEVETHRMNLLRTIQQLDKVLFAPLVEKPKAALRAKNMNEYLLQQDAYEEDQKRIDDSRANLGAYLQQQAREANDNRVAMRQQEQQLLAEKLPELRDPKRSKKVLDDISFAASYYGFTPEQVAQVDYHGLFLMARDAARWLNMQKIKKDGNLPSKGETPRKLRRMKGGSVSSMKAKAAQSSKAKSAAKAKAQKSGSVEDVAAMLSVTSKTRGQPPNGRRR